MSFQQQGPGRIEATSQRGRERSEKLLAESDRRAQESTDSDPPRGRLSGLLRRLLGSGSEER